MPKSGQAGVMSPVRRTSDGICCRARPGRGLADGGAAGRAHHGLRQVPLRGQQEGPFGEAQAEADPGQGSEVSSRYGEGDYQIKLRNLIRFLTEGDKAKVTLRFRGREMVHQDIGRESFWLEFKATCAEHAWSNRTR